MKTVSGYRVFFIGICLLSFLLTMYRIADHPHDLYVDEVAIGWNAWSILKTGKDEHGAFLPLSFASYGDYKLPVYIYLTALSESIIGKNELAVRLPSAISGIATVIVFMLLVKLTTKDTTLALISGLLLTTSPWHLQFVRGGFEASTGRFSLVLGVYGLLRGLLNNDRRFFYLGLTSFMLSLYSYHSSRLLVPILLLLITFLFRRPIRKFFAQRKTIVLGVLLLFLTIPFWRYAVSSQGMTRATSESFLRDLPQDIRTSPLLITYWEIDHWLKNYFSYFSIEFFFFAGDTIGRQSVRELGMAYLWQLPFFFYGLYYVYKRRNKFDIFFLGWFLTNPIAAALATPNPHALRSFPGVMTLIYFISTGMLVFFRRLSPPYRPVIMTALGLVIGFSLMSYLHIYYVHYPKRTDPDWSGGYKEAMQYAVEHEAQYEHIFFSKAFLNGYAYLYFYGNFDPQKILEEKDYTNGSGKFSFASNPVHLLPHSLYFAQPSDVVSAHKIGEIRNQGNDLLFIIWEI